MQFSLNKTKWSNGQSLFNPSREAGGLLYLSSQAHTHIQNKTKTEQKAKLFSLVGLQVVEEKIQGYKGLKRHRVKTTTLST